MIYNPLVFSDKTMSEMKSKMTNLIQLSKSQNTALNEMMPWLPHYPRVPLQPSVADKGQPLKHIHQWFEAHAKSRPDSIALSSDELGIQMTYGELQQSAEEKAMSKSLVNQYGMPFLTHGRFGSQRSREGMQSHPELATRVCRD